MRTLLGGVHVINEPTRKGRMQPDHVLGFYDPLRFSVAGMVIPGVGDHDACVIDVEFESTTEIRQKWSKNHKILVDSGDRTTVSEELEQEFSHLSIQICYVFLLFFEMQMHL